jgi:hypothetical protein
MYKSNLPHSIVFYAILIVASLAISSCGLFKSDRTLHLSVAVFDREGAKNENLEIADKVTQLLSEIVELDKCDKIVVTSHLGDQSQRLDTITIKAWTKPAKRASFVSANLYAILSSINQPSITDENCYQILHRMLNNTKESAVSKNITVVLGRMPVCYVKTNRIVEEAKANQSAQEDAPKLIWLVPGLRTSDVAIRNALKRVYNVSQTDYSVANYPECGSAASQENMDAKSIIVASFASSRIESYALAFQIDSLCKAKDLVFVRKGVASPIRVSSTVKTGRIDSIATALYGNANPEANNIGYLLQSVVNIVSHSSDRGASSQVIIAGDLPKDHTIAPTQQGLYLSEVDVRILSNKASITVLMKKRPSRITSAFVLAMKNMGQTVRTITYAD